MFIPTTHIVPCLISAAVDAAREAHVAAQSRNAARHARDTVLRDKSKADSPGYRRTRGTWYPHRDGDFTHKGDVAVTAAEHAIAEYAEGVTDSFDPVPEHWTTPADLGGVVFHQYPDGTYVAHC